MKLEDLTTKEDLAALKAELVETIKQLLSGQRPTEVWLTSKQVKQMLGGISPGTLQHLRNTGKLPSSHLGGGKLYFKEQDILDILERNYSKAA